MEIILTIILIVSIWIYGKVQELKATNYCNSYHIDWGKVNNDRIMNNLSNSQVNKNIINGKYDKGRLLTEAEIKAEQKASWEKYKKDHPWMPLN